MILQIGKNKMEVSDVYFTSDTHFFHSNIIKFCNRPFVDTKEMNEVLINNWNSVVPEDGIVFHLGDFCFAGLPAWENIRSKLNGKIYLILGNHDEKQVRNAGYERMKRLFEDIQYQYGIMIDNRKIYLNHYPFLCYAGTYRNIKDVVYMLHGHVHLIHENNTGLDFNIMKNCHPALYDVGVDFNELKPVSFTEIDKKIQYQLTNKRNQVTCWSKYLKKK